MNELKLFESPEFGQVRTVTIEDKPYFVAKDVATALGYADTTRAIKQHCRWVVKHHIPHPQSQTKTLEVNVIPEGDIYRLVTHSGLPDAEKFESWVFDEVLPTIRKTGGYVNNDEIFINTYLPHADEQTKLMFKGQLEVIKNLNTKIEQDKPKILFADAVSTAKTSILIGELAKLLKQNGVDTDQNRLFEWLRNNGYLIRRKGTDYNMPTQKSMEMKLFEVKETSIARSDGHIDISKTAKVTGKGQQYFINLFLADKVS
ncbi:MAG: phage antirepressor [Anaerotignaceae bacterium]